MEYHPNISPVAATDEPAIPLTPAPEADDEPRFATDAEEQAYWEGVTHGIRIAASPGQDHGLDGEPGAEPVAVLARPGRRRRHDGWTGAKMARFLEVLAGCGVVADACRAAGMSVQSAYALRNRRAGRAWAAAWEAILVHRARGRLSDEVLSRAINGVTERVVKDGEVVAERHRHDNRLAMAVLSRLDRLAEAQNTEEARTLRAVSEDFDLFLESLEEGGDLDGFIEERRPAAPKPMDEMSALTRLAGVPDYRDVHPMEIDVSDLDPDEQESWDLDAWLRAEHSYFLDWLDMAEEGECRPDGFDCAAEYMRIRDEIIAEMEAGENGEGEEEEKAAEIAAQPSTSSTSPPHPAQE